MIQNASGMSPVVLVLIAQMAHAASLSPPGGFWQDTTNSHEAGKVVVASTHPILYKLLNHSNNIAIASSLMVILLFTIGAPKTLTIYSAVVLLGTIAALRAVFLSYGTTVIISSPVNIQPGLAIAIEGSGVVLFLAAVVLIDGVSIKYRKWKRQNLQSEDHSFIDRIFRRFYRLHL